MGDEERKARHAEKRKPEKAKVPKARKSTRLALAATSMLLPATAGSAPLQPKPEGVEYSVAQKRMIEHHPDSILTPEELADLMSRLGPRISSTDGDLTTTVTILSNPLPLAESSLPGLAGAYSAPQNQMATVEVRFETPEGTLPSVIINTPTTWKGGSLREIVSERDSKYAFIIFEKCVVVTLGHSSVSSGERSLIVERDGRTVRLPSNSFYFMLPESAQGDKLFAYAANDSSFAFLDSEGTLRITPIDIEGSFLRRDIGEPEPGTRMFFNRGLLFVLRPAQDCINAYDTTLDFRPFSTEEQLSGEPDVVPTEIGFEATFPVSEGNAVTFNVMVQSEGVLASFLAVLLVEPE